MESKDIMVKVFGQIKNQANEIARKYTDVSGSDLYACCESAIAAISKETHKDSERDFPDLENMKQVLVKNIFKNHPELKENLFMFDSDVNVFSQIWPSTAGGFEEPGMIAGCAMTKQYTSVIRISIVLKDQSSSDYYGVFFGSKPAYIVENASEKFFEDLKEHRLLSKYKAAAEY